jgi:lipoprotein-anchoring transpeptidase ErfK/SrfK
MLRRALILLMLIVLAAPAASPALAAKKLLNLCGVSHPGDAGIAWECRKVKGKETPESLFGEQWKDVLRFNRIDRRHVYAGVSIKVPTEPESVAGFNPMPRELPEAAAAAKFILIEQGEQFLGAYEYGRLVFSFPVALGEKGHRTPSGEFRITAFDRWHTSNMYRIEKTDIPYPMYYGLRFYVSPGGVGYWIHGRDIPGYPVSHGCIGLYDETMQSKFYGYPKEPILEDARQLYEWVLGDTFDDGRFQLLRDGPRLIIRGRPPL